MEELSTLVNRFLRHLGFAVPTDGASSLSNSPGSDKILRDFFAQMKLHENVAFGALLLLHRFKDIPHNKSRSQHGHTFFMAAFSLSANALRITENRAFLRSETHTFALKNSLFPWFYIERARLSIIDDLQDNLTFNENLPLFKHVVQRDFKSDNGQQIPQYPRNLVTKNPQFLIAGGSRSNRGIGSKY